LTIHLFLPPRERLVDAEGRFENARRRLESMAESTESLEAMPPAHLRARPYATPIHETDAALRSWLELGSESRILVPGFSPVGGVLEAELRARIAVQGSAGPVAATATQIPAFLIRELEAGRDPEVPILFEAVLQALRPVFLDLQKSLAENGDLESLRFLEAYRRWFLDWEQAETWEAELRPWKDWIADLKEDLIELRLQASPGVQRRLPLRRLDRPGLLPVKHLRVVGMNEGSFPAAPAPAFFEEEGLRLLKTHEEDLVLQQALFLGLERVDFSYSEFSLSGRALPPSASLSDLPALEWISDRETTALSSAQGHPYFRENVRRERRRRDSSGGIDAGDLQNLGLETAILAKLKKHPLSATYLDDFAKCPWRFFARWQLQLKEEVQEDLEIEPKRRGGLMHRLLEEAIRELCRGFFEQGKIPSAQEVETSLELVFNRLQMAAVDEPSPVPRVLVLDQLERLRRSASALLGEEQATWSEAPEKLFPRHLEWSFGRGGQSPLTIALDGATRIPLTGAVDRIDVSSDGNRFLLIDYKSSRSEDLAREIRDGQSLQLWIYLQAVKRLLYPRAEALGALYWDVKEVKKNQGIARREAYQPYSQRKIPPQSRSFMKEEAFETMDQRLEEATVEILKRILAGDYILKPEKCLGAYCEFREICRYDEKPRN